MTSGVLFTKRKNRKLEALDNFGKTQLRWLNDFKFRPSVYGILNKGNKILVEKNPNLPRYVLPGGGVEIDESIENALTREFAEETGLKIRVGKLLGVSEDMFTFKDESCHGILIYYEVQKMGGRLLSNGNGSDSTANKFVDINDICEDNFDRALWKFFEKYKQQFHLAQTP